MVVTAIRHVRRYKLDLSVAEPHDSGHEDLCEEEDSRGGGRPGWYEAGEGPRTVGPDNAGGGQHAGAGSVRAGGCGSQECGWSSRHPLLPDSSHRLSTGR